jgi:hypothetical protein
VKTFLKLSAVNPMVVEYKQFEKWHALSSSADDPYIVEF